MKAFERYYPVIDDVKAFEEAVARPQPLFVWTNTLRTTTRQLVDSLEQGGYELTPLPWHPEAFRVKRRGVNSHERLGRHWAYLAGWFHIQEASSMIPALLLDPRPGERILDLCAAPGNKTALMAQALENRGTVVANDVFWDRIRPLRSAIDRLGLLNVSITCHDGTSYPKRAGQFDRVLVDVPCSCEGTARRFPRLLKRGSTRWMPKRFKKQKLLLKSAIRRCRKGGRILYSTCTYAPEENEAVVNAVLGEMPDNVRILPLSLPELRTAPGLIAWAGESFRDDLQNSIRIWPHLNDSGGFYIALLEKIGNDSKKTVKTPRVSQPDFQSAAGSTQQVFNNADEMFEMLQDRFGIGRAAFDGLRLFKKSGRDIYAAADDHRPPQLASCISGLPLFHLHFRFPKPTTSCAAAFGEMAERNVIDVSPSQLRNYLARRSFDLKKDQANACDGSSGYVMVRFQNAVMGVGYYDKSEGAVASLFPKSRARS
jgi:NOL1/NOP2/sun family putative RNA methylase